MKYKIKATGLNQAIDQYEVKLEDMNKCIIFLKADKQTSENLWIGDTITVSNYELENGFLNYRESKVNFEELKENFDYLEIEILKTGINEYQLSNEKDKKFTLNELYYHYLKEYT